MEGMLEQKKEPGKKETLDSVDHRSKKIFRRTYSCIGLAGQTRSIFDLGNRSARTDCLRPKLSQSTGQTTGYLADFLNLDRLRIECHSKSTITSTC